MANFVEFCPLHCREDNNVVFISDHFEMMGRELPKDAENLQMISFAEFSGKLRVMKSTGKPETKVLGFAFTTEKMDENEFVDLVDEDLSVFQEYLDGKVYHVVMTDIDECEEDIMDNVYEDSKSTKGHPLMLALKKKKKGKNCIVLSWTMILILKSYLGLRQEETGTDISFLGKKYSRIKEKVVYTTFFIFLNYLLLFSFKHIIEL